MKLDNDVLKSIELATGSLGNLNLSNSFENAIKSIELATGSLGNLNLNNSYEDAIRSIELTTGSLDNLSLSNSFENAIKSIELATGSLGNLNLTNSYEDAIKSIELATGSLDNLNLSNSYEDAIKSIELATGSLDNLSLSNSFENAIKSIELATESLDNLSLNAFDNLLKSEKNILSILLEEDDEENKNANKILYKSTFSSLFNIDYEEFKRLPLNAKIYIVTLLLSLMLVFKVINLGVDSGIELLADKINVSFSNDSNMSNKDKIRKIKKLQEVKNISLVDKASYRVISVKKLNVRSQATIKSESIDQLDLGDVIKIIEKKKNWMKVSYDVGTATIEGWIFTRYTKKLN